jgi:Methyltransferase domain
VTVVGPDGTHWPANSLRGIEHKSIRDFIQRAADLGYLSGRVLDYGAGRMPYREIVIEAGGDHWVYDSHTFPGSTVAEGFIGHDFNWQAERWDAILCTQVVQYLPRPRRTLREIRNHLYGPATDPRHGHLVLTYPTNWPEVEPEDLHRFTKAGMERLLTEAGFEIVLHERRAVVYLTGDINHPGKRPVIVGSETEFALGYGCVARA